ncbi:hypothetical protein DSECCO2_518460 [anaerobic digester metagenome]
MDVTAPGQRVCVLSDLVHQGPSARREERRNPLPEPEVSVVVPDEVEDREAFLPVREAEAPTELLDKDRETLGGAQEEDGVHFGDIDTLVVEVDNEDEVDLPGDEVFLDGGTKFPRAPGVEAGRRDACLPERCSHIFSVFHGGTEPEPDDFGKVGRVVPHGPGDQVRTLPVPGVEPGELGGIVAAPPPRHTIEVNDIGDAEVVERGEEFPVDRFRESDLGGDPAVEVPKNVKVVHPLRRCGEAEEDLRGVVGEQFLV